MTTPRPITASRLDLAFECQAWRKLPAVRYETEWMRRGIKIHSQLEQDIYAPTSDLGKAAVAALVDAYDDYEILGTEVTYALNPAAARSHVQEDDGIYIIDGHEAGDFPASYIIGRLDLIIRSSRYGVVAIDWKTGVSAPAPDSWQLKYAAVVTGADAVAIGLVDVERNEIQFLRRDVSEADRGEWLDKLNWLTTWLDDDKKMMPCVNSHCNHCDSLLFCPVYQHVITALTGVTPCDVAAVGDALALVEQWAERARPYIEADATEHGAVQGLIATWTIIEKSRRVVDVEHPQAAELLSGIEPQISYQITKIPRDKQAALEAAGVIKRMSYKTLTKKFTKPEDVK